MKNILSYFSEQEIIQTITDQDFKFSSIFSNTRVGIYFSFLHIPTQSNVFFAIGQPAHNSLFIDFQLFHEDEKLTGLCEKKCEAIAHRMVHQLTKTHLIIRIPVHTSTNKSFHYYTQ